MLASDFAFSFVESSSEINGVSSLYQVSLTLSVDTPYGAMAYVELPPEIKFDTTKRYTCYGTLNLQRDL